jgi:hypothetical protein
LSRVKRRAVRCRDVPADIAQRPNDLHEHIWPQVFIEWPSIGQRVDRGVLQPPAPPLHARRGLPG